MLSTSNITTTTIIFLHLAIISWGFSLSLKIGGIALALLFMWGWRVAGWRRRVENVSRCAVSPLDEQGNKRDVDVGVDTKILEEINSSVITSDAECMEEHGHGIRVSEQNSEILQASYEWDGRADVEDISSATGLEKERGGSHIPAYRPIVLSDGWSPKEIPYRDLVNATNSFSQDMMLGRGGFGPVYRGFLKDLGLDVAIKKLSERSQQGISEYMSEVNIITQLRHRNLVKLIGWCHEQRELLLVYEFMPNGSLDHHLFEANNLLQWPARYKIALGLANALMYLHDGCEPFVLHRDVKSSNVLLDSNLDVKLADFGLARSFDTDNSSLAVSCAAGTCGYWAPEYVMKPRASRRSDMYSYGVVALEIACGKKAIFMMRGDGGESREMFLVDWVWDLYRKGATILDAADKRLNGNFDRHQMKRLLMVGLRCAHRDAWRRLTARQASNALLYPQAPLPALPSEKTSSKRSFSEFFRWPKNWKQSPVNESVGDDGGIAKVSSLREFSYSDLVRATKSFSPNRFLGEGAFGRVYKGRLPSGETVAVKLFRSDSVGTGKEFLTEMTTLSCLTHKNLLKLLGWCHDFGYRFLVYEYMANGSLDQHLFGRSGRRAMAWEARYRVALGLASAIWYLHTQWDRCVLHRDIHPGNVLLDEEFNAKLGGFALARQTEHDHFWASAAIRVTVGYCAPEYAKTGKYTTECDVCLFGMAALQIACGRKPLQQTGAGEYEDIVTGVRRCLADGEILRAADPMLKGEFTKAQMERLMVIGLWCAHHEPAQRPQMAKVLRVLQFEEELPLHLPTDGDPGTSASSTCDCDQDDDIACQDYGASVRSMCIEIPMSS